MIDDERIERLLRARPASDATYDPTLAELLDGRRGQAPVSGVLRWRHDDPPLARLLPLVLLLGAMLVVATAMFVGGGRDDRLVDVEPTIQPVTPEPMPIFPADEASAILTRFAASHWPVNPGVLVDVAIQRDDRMWTAISGANAAATLGVGAWPGQTMVRIGATDHLFVAAAVLLLADRGQLDIDAPVSRYLTDWPGGEGITVRNLLDGSSGVAAFGEPIEDLVALIAAEPGRAWTAADALRIAREKAARYDAGTRHAPVDTEDVLLTAVVETVTSLSVMDVLGRAFRDIPEPVAVVPDPAWGWLPGPAWWDATTSGALIEVADLPTDVVAVLGPGRDMVLPVSITASLTHTFHTHPSLLSGTSRAMVERTFEEGGYGGIAMCPCTGDRKAGVGLVGHTGPYTALTVYVPSERLTISIVANAPVADADLEGLLQEIHDLVWPAIH